MAASLAGMRLLQGLALVGLILLFHASASLAKPSRQATKPSDFTEKHFPSSQASAGIQQSSPAPNSAHPLINLTDWLQQFRHYHQLTNFLYQNGSQYINSIIFHPFLDKVDAYDKKYSQDSSHQAVQKVALLKTAKTGCSTLASLLFRFAARHKLKIFTHGSGTVIPRGELAGLVEKLPSRHHHAYSIAFQHLSGKSPLAHTVSDVFKFYDSLIGGPRVITMVREPLAHALDWLVYMETPKDLPALIKLIETMPENVMAADFGIRTEEQMRDFLAHDWSRFALVCLTEKLDECAVMMRRLFNWKALDATHIPLIDGGNNTTRFDGKQLLAVPRMNELPTRAQQTLKAKTKLDQQLYQAATDRWKKLVAQQGKSYSSELASFRSLQRTLAETCRDHPNHPACRWYTLDDLGFHRLILRGSAHPVLFSSKRKAT